MKKIGELVCKYRTVILIIAILLLIPSIIGIKMTKINYDTNNNALNSLKLIMIF